MRKDSKFTLRDFTDIILRAEGRKSPEKLFNQIKGLAARRLITPFEDQYGQKGALLFSERECYRARLLIAALDFGVCSDDLTEVASIDMDAAVGAVTAMESEDWFLEIIRVRSLAMDQIVNSTRWVKGSCGLQSPDVNQSLIEAVLVICFTKTARLIFNQIKTF
jgi:hypothetical protein